MTPTQFERAAARTKVQPQNIAAARRVIVDGERLIDVAADLQIAKSRLSRACGSILAAWEVMQRAPVSWVTVTVRVPPAVAAQVKALARRARQERPRLPRGRPKVEG